MLEIFAILSSYFCKADKRRDDALDLWFLALRHGGHRDTISLCRQWLRGDIQTRVAGTQRDEAWYAAVLRWV